jgi:hypothetical protein
LIAPQQIKPYSEEGMILSVRRMSEDLHHPDYPDTDFHRFATQDSAFLQGILTAAYYGSPFAASVRDRLLTEHGVDIRDMLANWNGGHIEHR